MHLYSVELQGISTGEIERDSRRRGGYESENQEEAHRYERAMVSNQDPKLCGAKTSYSP